VVLERILKRRGHEVFTFPTPAKCPHYESPECFCPETEACTDFIITDVEMSEVSGLDFVEKQKRRNCKCQNYAVMSGTWTDEQMALTHGLGCFILEKPFEIKTLIMWLETCEMKIDPERKLNNWFQEKLR
jgi:YesN/AraC family two-component response regulator